MEHQTVEVSRVEKIREAVDEVLFDIGGLEPEEIVTDATFLDLGFDSLFLTQASTALRKKFGVKVTFRQLMEECSTAGTLVAFLDGKLPADQFMAEVGPGLVQEASAPLPAQPPVFENGQHQQAAASPAADLAIPTAPSATPPIGYAAPQPMAITPVAAMTPAMPAPTLPIANATSMERIVQLQLQQMQSLMTTQLQMVASQGLAAEPLAIPQPQVVPSPQAVPTAQVLTHPGQPATTPASPAVAPSAPPTVTQPAASNGSTQHPAASALNGQGKEGEQPGKGTSFGPWKPLNKSADDDLTPAQRQFVDSLMASYVAKTANSKSMTEEYRDVHADPRAVSGFKLVWKEMIYPIVVERSAGAHLVDVDGNDYVDMQSGFGSSLFGHSPTFVKEALNAQLERGVHIGPQMDTAGKTAQKISQLVGHERVTFCNTGSEAVMAAMRIARTVKGKDLIATFSGDYHGQFNEVLVRGVVRRGETRTLPIAPGIPPQSVENMLLLDFGDPESLRILNERADEIAAVLVEPVQSRHPEVQPTEFLQQLRDWTNANDACLIFDEVITGFRLTPRGAQGWYGIQADMASYGKVIGGGMPIGLLAGKRDYMDALDGGQWSFGDDSVPEIGVTYFAGTFVRHPLVVAAANAVADHLLANPTLQADLNERAERFVAQLNQIFTERSAPIRVEQCGSMLYFAFHEPTETDELFFFSMREKGIHIMSARAFFLTTAHSDDDLDRVCVAVRETTEGLQEVGFLSRNGVANNDSASDQSQSAPASALGVGADPVPFPLTNDQSGLWLASQLSDLSSCAYNESILLNLSGPLDVERMKQAVTHAIQRHDSYFLRFFLDSRGLDSRGPDSRGLDSSNSDGISQRVSSERTLEIRSLDFSSQGAPQAALEQLIETEATTPFDLEHGPLVRVNFVQLGQSEWCLHFVAHHIATDGFSTGVLVDEIRALYPRLVDGAPIQMEPAPSFRQYAAENAELSQSSDGRESLQYWLTELAELPDPLHLPGDRTRPARKSYQGDAVKWRFDPAVIAGVRDAARGQQTTLFNFMLTAFNAFLTRLTGQDDVVVGVPMAGQALYDMMDLTGFCVHFLPLRTRVTPDETFDSLLKRTQSKMLEGREFQPCALGNIIQAMNLPHDASRTPITDVAFNLDRPVSHDPIAGVEVTMDVAAKKAVAWDLFLNLTDVGETLVADCDYNTDILEAGTVTRWLDSFQTLLQAVIENPTLPVARIPLLSDAERQKLLVDWNQTAAPYPQELCLHQLVERQALKTPDATAILFEGQLGESTAVTYAQLNSRANQMAHYLLTKGAGPDKLIGLCVERSVEMMVGLLAILKAGAGYVPMDPIFPEERLLLMVEDADPLMILTESRFSTLFDSLETEQFFFDTHWDLVEGEQASNPDGPVQPHNLAYVIYTSGSTGKPKGVQIHHGGVVNFLASMANRPGLTADDAILSVTTISFDISVLELFLPLTLGAKVLLASQEKSSEPGWLMQALEQATVMQATPATWQMLLSAGWAGQPGLRILVGGEALSQNLAAQLLERCDELWNMYGPTETTIWSSLHRVTEDDIIRSEDGELEAGGPISIGYPIANTQLYILDQQLQPVPIGVSGNLYIGGDGLAKGYRNLPKLTAEKFIESPFGEGRVYQTGDMARYRPDGSVEFLGRSDFQVKIRGYRIELGEIEALLQQHPDISDAVVIAFEETINNKHLVAYCISHLWEAKNDSKPLATVTELRSYLGERLPEYMVPSTFIFLDSLPLTPNGKVNRKALPQPEGQRPAQDAPFVAPTTPNEKLLAQTWSDILEVENIGIHDNFFVLGGHSLQAVRVIARLRDALYLELNLRTFFNYPTICGMAEQVTQMIMEDENDEDMLAMIHELEGMSQEEINALLP